MLTRNVYLGAIILVGTLLPAHARIIVSADGPDQGGGAGIFPNQNLWMSFTVGATYTGVEIQAELAGNFPGTAYLTNQIGPGTTVANVIASNGYTVTAGFPPAHFTTVLQNLTLNSGTYFLVLVTTSNTIPQGIEATDAANAVVVTDTGASNGNIGRLVCGGVLPACDGFHPGYIVATGFGGFAVFHYSVADAVPEASTWSLLRAGLTVLIGRRKFGRLPGQTLCGSAAAGRQGVRGLAKGAGKRDAGEASVNCRRLGDGGAGRCCSTV